MLVRYTENEMLRFLRNLTAYVIFEMAEIIASILGIIAIVCFVVVAYLSFQFFADKVPTAVNLSLSFVIGLAVSLMPGYAAVRLGKISD
jgi:hypothetical protein